MGKGKIARANARTESYSRTAPRGDAWLDAEEEVLSDLLVTKSDSPTRIGLIRLIGFAISMGRWCPSTLDKLVTERESITPKALTMPERRC